jgi:hypothetical protein
MMKRAILLLFILSTAKNSFSLSDADWHIIRGIRLGSVGLGTVGGAVIGGGTATLAEKELGKSKKFAGPITRGTYGAGMVGAAAGSLGGAVVGDKLAFAYIAKKYSVSPRIARTAAYYNIDLSNTGQKAMLIAAEQQNKEFLKAYVASRLKILGDQGKKEFNNTADQFFKLAAKNKYDFQAWKEFQQKLGVEASIFNLILEQILPLAVLYFNYPIPGLFVPDYFHKREIEVVHQFIDALGL